jgi:hypothetical protein
MRWQDFKRRQTLRKTGHNYYNHGGFFYELFIGIGLKKYHDMSGPILDLINSTQSIFILTIVTPTYRKLLGVVKSENYWLKVALKINSSILDF